MDLDELVEHWTRLDDQRELIAGKRGPTQVVTPGTPVPPQREALEKLRDYLVPQLDGNAADRVSSALKTLIRLRQIRVAGQHSDTQHKAVAPFREIGLPFPPVTWDQAWTHVAGMARGALDVLREEVHADLPET